MQFTKQISTLIVIMMASLILFSCSKEDSNKICFTVDKFNVKVYNVWKDGTIESVNVRGLLSFTQTITRSNETHKFVWSNINNDYANNTVASFDVNIDGKNYRYPKNKCSFNSSYDIIY